jgi:hypothetical protein
MDYFLETSELNRYASIKYLPQILTPLPQFSPLISRSPKKAFSLSTIKLVVDPGVKVLQMARKGDCALTGQGIIGFRGLPPG